MAYSILLYFDQKTESAIQSIWQRLADEGIASYMHSSGIRPHISLAIFREFDPAAGEAKLKSLAGQTARFPLTFSHLGIFLSPEAVVFVAPTVTTSLTGLHRKTWETFSDTGLSPWEYYLPENWVPHCTLAMDLTQQGISPAIGVAGGLALPMQAQAVEIGLIEFRPVRHLFSFALKDQP